MKIQHVVIVVVAMLSATGLAAQRPGSPGAVTVIEGATVIDGVSNEPIRDAVLVIEGERIRSIGRRGSIAVPAGATRIGMAGRTIMPGMFALHAHPGLERAISNAAAGIGVDPDWERIYAREWLLRDLNAYLYYGVTHVASLGLDGKAAWGVRSEQRAGRTGGARLYPGGLGFSAPGGHEPGGIKQVHRPATPDEARAMVRAELANQPDVLKMLKIWLDDHQGTIPELAPEVYGAIIDEAHKNDPRVRVLAHVRTLEDAKELIRRGVDGLAHPPGDREVDEEFLQLAKDHGITQIMTLGSNFFYAEGASFLDDPGLPLLFPAIVVDRLRSREYRQERVAQAQQERARAQRERSALTTVKIARAGVPIAVGTDSGGSTFPPSFLMLPGLSEQLEMAALVTAGLTPMQAIQAATINGARFLRVDQDYGSLQPGKVADVIVLTGDPLADITNSRQIEAVWMNGRTVDRRLLGPARLSSK